MSAGRAAIAQLLRRVDPDLRLVRADALTGGVSAQVTAVRAERPDGSAETLVVRRYGTANLRADPQPASREFRLLSLLSDAGLPVPRPRYADDSGTVLGGPCLVIDFIDGAPVTGPAQLRLPLADFAGQLAAVLARIHQAELTAVQAPYLRSMRDAADERIRMRPEPADLTLSEPAVRAALDRIWPPPPAGQPVLLHGDYWPGNTLWRDGALVCVLDWEDAALGDPVADLANARMELTMVFGAAAADGFTRQYAGLRPELDLCALPHWDLYAALRHAGRMPGWGLPAAELTRLQNGHREFTAAALAAAPV